MFAHRGTYKWLADDNGASRALTKGPLFIICYLFINLAPSCKIELSYELFGGHGQMCPTHIHTRHPSEPS